MKTQEQNKILPAEGYIKFQCKHTHAVWNSEALPVTAEFMARFEEADAFRTEVFEYMKTESATATFLSAMEKIS